MADWSFHTYDAVTGKPKGPVIVAQWDQTVVLNDAGSWSAMLAPPQTTILSEATIAATEEGKAFIVPVRDGKLVDGFSGWVPPGGRRRPELAGAGLLSWLDRQVLRSTNIGGTTLTYAGVDQFTMVADLVDRAQVGSSGIDIDTSEVGTSGVLRDQTWFSWESKNIGEAIRQKAAVIDGFDFDVRVELDAGVTDPVRRLRCWYPRRGRPIESGQCPVFSAGKGGNVFGVPVVGGDDQMATVVHAVGAETGDVIVVGDSEVRVRLTYATFAGNMRIAGYPSIVVTLDLPDVKSLSTLLDHAKGYLALHGLEELDDIVLDVNPNDVTWPWGSWDIGDDCRVQIPTGLSPWWPDGLDTVRRITAHHWTYDADGERLQVITGQPLDADVSFGIILE